MTLPLILTTVGLACCWRAFLARDVPVIGRYGLMVLGGATAILSLSAQGGVGEGLWTAPLALGVSFGVAWVSQSYTERWSRPMIVSVGVGGLLLILGSLAAG